MVRMALRRTPVMPCRRKAHRRGTSSVRRSRSSAGATACELAEWCSSASSFITDLVEGLRSSSSSSSSHSVCTSARARRAAYSASASLSALHIEWGVMYLSLASPFLIFTESGVGIEPASPAASSALGTRVCAVGVAERVCGAASEAALRSAGTTGMSASAAAPRTSSSLSVRASSSTGSTRSISAGACSGRTTR
eukprot:6123121-Pyramimonas_sp.AAC.2